jgi:4-alpha-glucanotransferase
VGEDLGTVPAVVIKSLAVHGVKRMFVVQFEASDDARRPLGDVPAGSVASLNTHDMPPFAAYWEGRDADLRKELDLIDETGVAEAHQTRARTAAALSRSLGHSQVLDARAARDALLQLLAGSSADIVLVNLEDLWLETEPQNVPGTSEERPNWRRRLKRTLAELRADPHVRETLAVVQRARQAGPGTGTGTEHQHGHAHVTRDTE